MIIDPRAGSSDYIVPLRKAGIPIEDRLLDYGDVEIEGRGADGPVLVGVEVKKVGDLLSCIRDGRAAEQLRGMKRTYTVSWLLIEGFMTEADGDLYVMSRNGARQAHGSQSYSEVAGWCLTMSQSLGILLMRTYDQSESVAWLRSLYYWWTASAWEQHRSHLAMYTPPMPMDGFEEPPLRQRVAAVLPGIGSTRAAAVAEYFPTIDDMFRADAKAWQQVEGIGKKTAERVVAAVKGSK